MFTWYQSCQLCPWP